LTNESNAYANNKRNSHASETTASCIPIQLQTQVMLMETKLDEYTNEFRLNQTNFDEKITNTVDNAIHNVLKGFTESIKIETTCAESILIKIKKTILESENSAKNVGINIENSIGTGKQNATKIIANMTRAETNINVLRETINSIAVCAEKAYKTATKE